MSGTSVDGIDAALVEIVEQRDELRVRLLGYEETPHTATLRARVLALCRPESSSIDETCLLNAEIGEAFAAAARAAITRFGAAPDLIASHGQTVWHHVRADGSVAATLQLGEPSVLAERLGVTVIADFRPRDVAAGGQGAPLASYPDSLLFADHEASRAIQNLGGIGNVTWLPSGRDGGDLLAFDTGPGNALIDHAVARLTGERYDDGGRLARGGTPNQGVVAELLTHPYFAQPPPKSTGRELYTAAYGDEVVDRLRRAGASDADVVATLTLFTARSVADQYRRFLPRMPDEVVLGGGGSKNPTLRQMLAGELGGVPLRDHDDFGLPSTGREAIYFAVLGYQALHGRPNTVPACTGATRPVVMGKIVPGANYPELARAVRPGVRVRTMRIVQAGGSERSRERA